MNRNLKNLRESFEHTEWCPYCGSVLVRHGKGAARFTLDHIIPLSQGGKNDESNLTPCCKQCNNDRGSLSVLAYLFIRRYGRIKVEKNKPIKVKHCKSSTNGNKRQVKGKKPPRTYKMVVKHYFWRDNAQVFS